MYDGWVLTKSLSLILRVAKILVTLNKINILAAI